MSFSTNVCCKCFCREHNNWISKDKKYIIHKCSCGHKWKTKNFDFR